MEDGQAFPQVAMEQVQLFLFEDPRRHRQGHPGPHLIDELPQGLRRRRRKVQDDVIRGQQLIDFYGAMIIRIARGGGF